MTSFAQITLTPVQAFAEMAQRRISVTSAFGGRVWVASVEQVRSKKRFTKADMVIVSATGPTPLAAVAELVKRLYGATKETALFEEECPW